MTPAENKKKWLKDRLDSGWQAVYFVVPKELAAILKKTKAQYKVDNNHLWKRFN